MTGIALFAVLVLCISVAAIVIRLGAVSARVAVLEKMLADVGRAASGEDGEA